MQRGLDYMIPVALWLMLSAFVVVESSEKVYHDPMALESFVHDYANKTLAHPRTGTVYNISMPANFSGIQVSIVRLRSSSFWVRGENFSFFHIPPRIIATPYYKRMAIVFENLQNWSSVYYQVPGHKFVSPVVGFRAYDAPNASVVGKQNLNLSIRGDPISIRFPRVAIGDEEVLIKCVQFGLDGSVRFSNMTEERTCITQSEGHFSLAIPFTPDEKKKEEDGGFWKWWVIGFVGGFIVIVLSGLCGLVIYKMVKRKKIKEMEKESERGVPFDTFWIGRTKMPCASTIRTEPVLENEHI